MLAISRIAEIHKAIPNTHLVMHGSSSVPQEWLEMINKFGGQIPETYGVPVEEIQEGIRNGVRKVNIDTDNRLAFTAAVREAAAADPANFDPRHFNKPARKYMKQVCLDRYTQFWAAGNASKIKFVINHLVCVLTAANAEAMAMGLKAGLQAEDIFDLVKDSAANSVLWEIRGPMMVSEDYTSSRGNFGMASKDGPVIGEFAQQMFYPAPLFQTALQMHQAAVGMGMYDIDTAAMCRLYETLSGTTRQSD